MVLCIQEVAHRHRLKIGTLGHMGDGNLHPTFLTNETNKEEMCRVEEAMKEIFAHHGAGATLSVKAVFKPTKDFHTARALCSQPSKTLRSTRWCRCVRALRPS